MVAGSASSGATLCEINITPLIDVMLVLLVTLVVTLPIMTHAVKLDMPPPEASRPEKPPEVIDVDIDSDGTLVWNGAVIAGFRQLESNFRSEAGKIPQPEIHLHPDRHAKYDSVAQVLAAAQRNHMERVGFVNTGDFDN